jgi:hypothetical protein
LIKNLVLGEKAALKPELERIRLGGSKEGRSTNDDTEDERPGTSGAKTGRVESKKRKATREILTVRNT